MSGFLESFAVVFLGSVVFYSLNAKMQDFKFQGLCRLFQVFGVWRILLEPD